MTTNDIVNVADVSESATKAMTMGELLAGLKLLGIALDDLSDATITNPLTGDVFEYTGSGWQNVPLAASVVTVESTSIVNSSATDAQSTLEDLDAAIQSAAGTGVPSTLADAAGDLLVADGNDSFAKLTKGSDYTFLGVNGSGSVAYGDPRAVPQTANAQSGTTYTLVIGDAGELVTLSNSSSITLTVPQNSSVAFPVGTVIDLLQLGAGQVTVAADTNVTIDTSSTLKLRAQYSGALLVKTATNTWVLVGDLEPLGQSINSQTGTT
jgi:hypothetical protein